MNLHKRRQKPNSELVDSFSHKRAPFTIKSKKETPGSESPGCCLLSVPPGPVSWWHVRRCPRHYHKEERCPTGGALQSHSQHGAHCSIVLCWWTQAWVLPWDSGIVGARSRWAIAVRDVLITPLIVIVVHVLSTYQSTYWKTVYAKPPAQHCALRLWEVLLAVL